MGMGCTAEFKCFNTLGRWERQSATKDCRHFFFALEMLMLLLLSNLWRLTTAHRHISNAQCVRAPMSHQRMADRLTPKSTTIFIWTLFPTLFENARYLGGHATQCISERKKRKVCDFVKVYTIKWHRTICGTWMTNVMECKKMKVSNLNELNWDQDKDRKPTTRFVGLRIWWVLVLLMLMAVAKWFSSKSNVWTPCDTLFVCIASIPVMIISWTRMIQNTIMLWIA